LIVEEEISLHRPKELALKETHGFPRAAEDAGYEPDGIFCGFLSADGCGSVEINGEKMIEQKFRSQIDCKVQRVKYIIIDVQTGDEIDVGEGCNISGS
jgi:hypothetical protein